MHRAGIRKPLLMTAGRAVQSLPVSPHIQKLKSKAEHWCDPSAWKHSPEPVSTPWRKACLRWAYAMKEAFQKSRVQLGLQLGGRAPARPVF